MRFLLVDDVRPILDEETSLLKELMPESEIYSCTNVREARKYIEKEHFDVAFLDVELGTMNGIALAKLIKDTQPDINIIFVTGFSNYALDAFSVHATGYLLKPLQKEQLKRELTFLYGKNKVEDKKVKVQTFGNFEVWVNGEKLTFGRQKAKELFAYLIERRGAGVTTREACAVLFEDSCYDHTIKSYFQTIVSDMRNTFKNVGMEDIIRKSYNSLSVDTDLIDCDYYRFLSGDAKAINGYNGEFMMNYSWAEFVAGTLIEV